MFYDENIVQDVKDTADIIEIVGENVNLTKAGVNFKGLCPFHTEKTPSFTVSPSRRSFHCFGCGEGGDVLAFVMRLQNVSFVDALKSLAGRYNITLPEKVLSKREQESSSKKKVLVEVNRQAAEVYHQFLLNDKRAESARKYIEKRAVPEEVIASFKLGYAPESWDFLLNKLSNVFSTEDMEDAGLIVPNNRGGFYDRFRNRVLFPIYSHSGQNLGFGGRILGDQMPKYLNSPESLVFNKSRNLFGLYQGKEALRNSRRCLIVEGNFDLIALVSRGVYDVVAPLGTALTQQHVRAIKGYSEEALLLFDGDKAGIQAAMRSVPIFLSEKLPARVVVLPGGHDPDTFITEFGREGLDAALEKAHSLPEFVFDHLVEKHDLSLEGKGRIIEDLKPIIQAISDRDLQRTLFVSHFSQKLGLSPEKLLSSQGTSLRPAKKKEKKTEPVMDLQFSKTEEQLLSFLIIYPEYYEKFAEAGLCDAISHPSAQVIVNRINELQSRGNFLGPEQLLSETVGPERSFISKQLISAPDFPEQEEEALEKIAWLKENSLKVRMRSLTARINEAQQQNDEKLLMELLAKKSKIYEKYQEK